MINVETKKLKLSQINLNPDNPRTISNRDMDRLVKSLQEFPEMMQLREIVIDETMTVLGGNMRTLALRKAGASEVIAKIVTGLTPEQKREFVIKDNSAFGEWDMDALANGWSDLPLNEWGLDVPAYFGDDDEVVEDDFDADEEAEKITIPETELGDIWTLGRHRLICGDSRSGEDVSRLMAGEQADMIWTDPPYGVDYTEKNDFLNKKRTGTGHKKIEGDNLRGEFLYDMLQAAFKNMSTNCNLGACFYVAHADINSAEFKTAMKDANIHLSQSIIWVKGSAVLSRNDYNWRHEPILYGWKEGAAHYFCQDFTQTTVIDDEADIKKMTKAELIATIQDMKKQIPETVFREDRPSKNELHPTMKPIALVARMIRNSSNVTQEPPPIVLDTFGGSGTTLMACEQIGRTAYLCELDPIYCDVIKLRWEKFTGEKGVLE